LNHELCYPGLFIKNADAYFSSAISGGYPDIAEETFQEEFFLYSSPVLAHLLRYDPFAVDDHSGMGHASHLHQPRLVNNPG